VEPGWVLLPAANPNVELCERDPAGTRRVNVEGVRVVAQSCRDHGARLLFFSSDYIFDGRGGPYREEDEARPIQEYGRQKWEAEGLVREILPDRHLIARVTVVYGWEKQGKNFLARLRRTLASGETLPVPQDQIGSPTLVDDLADAVWSLVETGAAGTFHVAGPDWISRYEFALAAARTFGLPGERIVPCATPSLGQAAPRPLRAGMVSERAERLIGRRMLGVQQGLSRLKHEARLAP
jgi:dTDP-4-dehydrorhamnose reductase